MPDRDWITAHRQFLAGWLASNEVDPATVLDDGSLDVAGDTIHYVKATAGEGGGIHRQPMTAPLLVTLEEYRQRRQEKATILARLDAHPDVDDAPHWLEGDAPARTGEPAGSLE